LQHDQFFPGKVVRREGDPPVTDAAVNEAYDNAGITYDFFAVDRRQSHAAALERPLLEALR
jgi:Zn-dependent metalloprotease